MKRLLRRALTLSMVFAVVSDVSALDKHKAAIHRRNYLAVQ